jgi:pyruvate dehydrogenase E1 component beta subunit
MAATLLQIPGLKIVAPATPATAAALLKAAIRDPGPVAVLEHSTLYAGHGPLANSGDAETCEIGRARIAAPGTDLTIVTYGRSVSLAHEAAAVLEGEGISAEIVDLMSLRPLDAETVVRSVRKTRRLMTLEEGLPGGGIGAEIIAAVTSMAFDALTAAPVRLAGRDVPMPYAEALQTKTVPSADDIIAAARALFTRR